MLKRLPFIAALFGFGAAAQTKKQTYQVYRSPDWKMCEGAPGGISKEADPFWGCIDDSGNRSNMQAAANNQCPTCGTMAEKYVRQYHPDGILRNCKSANGGYLMACDPQREITQDPESRLVRCSRCNAAFFQDASD